MGAPIDLDGLRCHAAVTAPGGVIDARTEFAFIQRGDVVESRYSGGRVEAGYLIGRLNGSKLEFRYCQTHTDGEITGGHSRCDVRVNADGMVEIVEEFEWTSGGKGTNIIREL
ncbi:MAG: hypothetical protein ED559_02455 [Phycisphaera sp.]|nr:MAG: hypothetical protein ED559_02455 [Phycisphaera sp.]